MDKKNIFLNITVLVSLFFINFNLKPFAQDYMQEELLTEQIDNQLLVKKLEELSQEVKTLSDIVKNNNKTTSEKKAAKSKIALLLSGIGNTFKFVVDKCDKLTSKKFIIASLIVVSPLLVIYCKYFNSDFINKLFHRSVSAVGEKAVEGGLVLAEKATDAVVKTAVNNPMKVAKIASFYAGIRAFASITEKTVLKLGETSAPIIIDTMKNAVVKIPTYALTALSFMIKLLPFQIKINMNN